MRRTYLVRPTHYLKRCSERACRRTAQFALDRAARHAAHAPGGSGGPRPRRIEIQVRVGVHPRGADGQDIAKAHEMRRQ
jgi:hypothetical protein